MAGLYFEWRQAACRNGGSGKARKQVAPGQWHRGLPAHRMEPARRDRRDLQTGSVDAPACGCRLSIVAANLRHQIGI